MESENKQGPSNGLALTKLLRDANKSKSNLLRSLFSLVENLNSPAGVFCVGVDDLLLVTSGTDYMELLLDKQYFNDAKEVVALLEQFKIDHGVKCISIDLRLSEESYSNDILQVVDLLMIPIKKICGQRVEYVFTDWAEYPNLEPSNITILAFGKRPPRPHKKIKWL